MTGLRLVPAGDSRREVPKPLGVTGAVSGRAGAELIGLGVAEARHHLHVLGPTGTGKSTLLLRLILADTAAGRGTAVIDPHGDLALRILERLPQDCLDRLVLIDPEQDGPSVCWNVLDPALVGPELVTEHLVATLRRLYSAWWGPRLEDTLRAACLTLTHPENRPAYPRARERAGETATERASERGTPTDDDDGAAAAATLADIPLLLTHPSYRARVTAAVRRADPGGLGAFWDAYDALTPAQLATAGGPVLSKLRAITSRRFVLDLLGSAPSTLDLGEVLDGGILIARLPKGILGEDTTRLVGSLLLTGLWQAATARTRRPEPERLDAAVVVDECHNFLHLPIGLDDALAEARSYRLSWVLAHQHLGQLPKPMADAIDANARNKIRFGLSPQDAHVQARHTLPHLTEDDLARLDAHQIACRLLVGHQPVRPFTLTALPPPPAAPGGVDRARRAAAAHGLPDAARRDHTARRRRLAVTSRAPAVAPALLGPDGVLSEPDPGEGAARSLAHSPARSPPHKLWGSERATPNGTDPQVIPRTAVDPTVPD